jgi:hypothetical protein
VASVRDAIYLAVQLAARQFVSGVTLDELLERALRTALDEVVQMMGGLAYMTGRPGDPLRAGTSVNDIMGGLFGAIGALGALIDPRRNREPLEEFPLDSLRLVGTLSLRGQQFALIKDPTAVVHRVTLGNYLGQNYGKITTIAESEIALREIVPDGFGGFIERPATVAAPTARRSTTARARPARPSCSSATWWRARRSSRTRRCRAST